MGFKTPVLRNKTPKLTQAVAFGRYINKPKNPTLPADIEAPSLQKEWIPGPRSNG